MTQHRAGFRSDPTETRTPVCGVRGRRPRPLDDGANERLFGVRGLEPRLTEPESAVLPIRRYPSCATCAIPCRPTSESASAKGASALFFGGRAGFDHVDVHFITGLVDVDAVPSPTVPVIDDVHAFHAGAPTDGLPDDAAALPMLPGEVPQRSRVRLCRPKPVFVDTPGLGGHDHPVYPVGLRKRGAGPGEYAHQP